MSQLLQHTFTNKTKQGTPVFVAFLTAGFPTLDATVEGLLALQEGGADVIELGIPHTEPIADGETIQYSSKIALEQGVTIEKCIEYVKEARHRGLKIPVVLMGYYNPFFVYGEEKIIIEAKEAGLNGFIVVDLPPDEGGDHFINLCKKHGLSFVPLITIVTPVHRLNYVNSIADSFVYCVSLLGITGENNQLAPELSTFVTNARKYIKKPIAIGFGIKNQSDVRVVSNIAEGVVVGSLICKTFGEAPKEKRAETLKNVVADLLKGSKLSISGSEDSNAKVESENPTSTNLTLPAYFGKFGGRYSPEILMAALHELEYAYAKYKDDPEFIAEVRSHYDYIGRPTPLHKAHRTTEVCGGAQIWLKREDLCHTGAHKINNAVGQAILAKKIGKTEIIAETGAGQHGVATATICAKLGLKCTVYMGSDDIQRQALNVFRMQMLGATVVSVNCGSRTLKDAVNEAMRNWVKKVRTTHYLVGSAIGPHPFPTMVRDFQSVIGQESRKQMIEKTGRLPDAVVACVGGGSNAIGMFHPFVEDKSVKLYGVEAAGEGMEGDKHCATLAKGSLGILHGVKTYVLQDHQGQIKDTHSISAGLDYPGVGPEHAFLKDSGRATYVCVDDKEFTKNQSCRHLKDLRLLLSMKVF
eukprot:TRINITY_DN71_c0_g1_i2.p1 TRINITY_DN71_c0_g1~~TRINITY_DN71_c0_g1_i2.p1  ORF type:complete len:640 (-),score=130.07 TRINITY_DN71_c0_g1_i2:188-2107(-)